MSRGPYRLGDISFSEQLIEVAVEGAVRDFFLHKFRNILLDSDTICVFFKPQDRQQQRGLVQCQILHIVLLIYLYGLSVKIVT